jgi:2-haloacid dehalogenase
MIDFAGKRVMTFDCYGTLIDWETGLLAAITPVLASHAVTAEPERILALFGEMVLAAVLPELAARLGATVSADEATRFADSVGEWPPFPDSPAALAALGRRFKLGIVSNVDDDLFVRSNHRLGVRFDWIVTAQQVRSYKPAPNHFHTALERIGLPASQVLHVAQSLYHDHVPAKALGLDTVWVNRRRGKAGAGATPPATAQPDLEVPDLATLARLAGAT